MTTDLLKKVRKVEIKTRGLSKQIFSGEYHSAFKGRGMAFSEVRDYMPGDEIRTIDWNVTARFNSPFVKVFEEERELTVMLLVDVSGSEQFGTRKQLKQDLITELCAVLAFSAIQNNDKTGIIFFSDKVEKFIPPKKGKTHILRIIRELIEFKPENKQTDIAEGVRYLSQVIKKRCITFLISDFKDMPGKYEKPLQIANRKHDFVALNIHDHHENELPNLGLVCMQDNETGENRWVNTASKKVRKEFKIDALRHRDETEKVLKRAGVDFANLSTHESYITPLLNLLKRR